MVRFVIVSASALLFMAAACSEQPSPVSPSPVPSVSVVTPSFSAPMPSDDAASWGTRGPVDYMHWWTDGEFPHWDTKRAQPNSNPCALWHNHATSTWDPSTNKWNCAGGITEYGSTVNILD